MEWTDEQRQEHNNAMREYYEQVQLMEEWFAKHGIATIEGRMADGTPFSFSLPIQGKK